MRISDWSSDVCSSDLLADQEAALQVGVQYRVPVRLGHLQERLGDGDAGVVDQHVDRPQRVLGRIEGGADRGGVGDRSEEHTSELQSLMRISYAVFCLKKKKQKKNTINHNTDT